MQKVFRAIRFSSVGVFFTGIIGVLQGCSVEREGALFAVLLLLLNFCSGPVDTGPDGPPPPLLIDGFTDVDSHGPSSCTATPPVNSVAVTNGAMDERTIRAASGSSGTGDNTITVGSGEFVFSYSSDCLNGARISITSNAGIDASAYSQLVIPVTALTGASMTCDIFMENNLIFDVIVLNDEPITSPLITIDISNTSRNKVTEIQIIRCTAGAASSFTLGPLEFR